MSVPTNGEVFAKLIEDIAHTQEGMAMMGHLVKADASNHKQRALADGWIALSELMKRVNHQVIEMAKSKLQ